jgi:hypothetical protein
MFGIVMICGCSNSRSGSDGIAMVGADTPDDKLADAVKKKGPNEQKPDAAGSANRPVDELVRTCLPAVALVKGKCGHGAGFLLPQNVVATNAHVVNLEFEENIRVHFPSAPKGKQGPYKAKFIWADRRRDLAFLEVICDIEPLELAEDYTLRPGQEIIAIGSPGLGDNEFLPNAPAKGLMSNLTKLGEKGREQSFYAMSISVNPGNSGGPVIDMQGHVLGMVTLKARDKDGIAFAIPLEDLNNGYHQEVLAQGREAGAEMKGYIRAMTVFERLLYLGDEYCYGLDTYSKAMDMAAAQGGLPSDGLRAVSREMSGHLKQTNKFFADDLEKNVALVVKDKDLAEMGEDWQEIQRRIDALWKCCRDMKAMIDSPTGTVDSYRFRKEQLKMRYRDLAGTAERPKKPTKKAQKKPDDDDFDK